MTDNARARSAAPATEHEPIEAEGRRRTGDWLEAQHEYPLDGVAGEPIEPTLEDRASPLLDGGEPDAGGDGEMLELRSRDAEPERHPEAREADPPETA